MELQARTPTGTAFVRLAEELAGDLATRASLHDREGTTPSASFDALRLSGWFTAPVPTEHGGLGITSIHDLAVASSRLARGDASVAIGANMHFAYVTNVLRRWQMAVASGNDRRAGTFASSLEWIANGGVVLAAAISERGQDLTRPGTTATRNEDGWRIDGGKIFCTMATSATDFYVAVRFADGDPGERYGYVLVPAGAPGVTIHDDWDAMGMRGSASNSVTFEGVQLPESALRGGFPAGETVPYLERNLTAGVLHATSSLGIAEAALGAAVEAIAGRALDGHAESMLAEAAVELAAVRAIVERGASLLDEYWETFPTTDGPDDEVVRLSAEIQAAKTFANAASVRIADRALALAGGGAYRNGSAIARAYRDARAGAFMHPLGANRAHGFLADATLGESPLSSRGQK